MPPGTRFLRVAVERSIDHGSRTGTAADHALTYRTTDADITPGDRVRVPLGRRDTAAPGIVVRIGGAELLDGFPPSKVKSVLGRTGSALPAGLLPLAEWLAHYYVCPLGMALSSMMPAAVKRGTGTRQTTYLHLLPAATPPVGSSPPKLSPPKLSPQLRKHIDTLRALPPSTFPLTPASLKNAANISAPAVKKLTTLGVLRAETRSEVHAHADIDDDAADTPAPSPAAPGARPSLNADQSAAVAGISATLGTFAAHLLLGVTGSGKTEVYLRVIEAALARSQSAIVLVPEIALTPQTSRRFIDRLGAHVAVLHSGLSASQRHAQWAACAAGTLRVVVGARSAIFAPLGNVGVIVVDEEHDSSYKQDQLPRYHARDVAVKRAHLAGCPVVLGSATPSLESYANAIPAQIHPASTRPSAQCPVSRSRRGDPSASSSKYHLWHLPRRATGSPMPRVQIVDLADERRLRSQVSGWRDRHLHLLGPTLERALEQTLCAGGQAMLLLNRRGYANYITCADPKCGWVMGCTDCDATMVYHHHRLPERDGGSEHGGERAGFVRCHHCLTEVRLPKVCPLCAGNINTFGLGTQRVEEELERKFTVSHGLKLGDTLLRLDSDTMHTAKDYFRALDRFASGKARVLLGTQMIAKGLDFPNVRLVGVINADTALALPDFRATERTYQLVSQVAGRAGRADHPGLVIVQTMEPAAPAITLAARHDYPAFAAAELQTRIRSGLPPATRMARIVCRDTDHAKATSAARTIHAALSAAIAALPVGRLAEPTRHEPPPVRLRPPFPCPLARIANHHRIAIEFLASTRGIIQHILQSVRAQGLLKSDTHTAVDVDPMALL